MSRPKTNTAVAYAADLMGGCSKLGYAVGVHPVSVWQWRAGTKPVPPAKALRVYGLTGVPPQQLRPDYPWEELFKAARDAEV